MQMTKKVQTINTARALVDTLVELKIDSIFGYPGASVLSIYNELAQTEKIKHFLVRHEQAAVHAAEGYARVSGKVGTVLVTSGPGFTNTVTGIANAYADSTPLVILAGSVDITKSVSAGKIFQNIDIYNMVKSCCKKIITVSDKDDIKQVIKSAYSIADSGVKGPVTVVLPRNVLESEYIECAACNITESREQTDFTENINHLYELINSAKKPLVLIGGGCQNASGEIEKFVSKLQCPVVSTLMGIGIYPSENDLYLGMIGQNGVNSANYALQSCDLLIALGVSFSDRSTCKNTDFANNADIISINIEKTNKNCKLEIKARVEEFLSQFNKKHHSSKFDIKRLLQIENIKENIKTEDIQTEKLHSSYVLEKISEYTKYYEPIVVTDVGQHQMLTAQFFNFNKPRKFITSGGMGTMGFGLPAAIGASIANPDNLVLNITGDGSYQMNLQELATCREHNIPVKIIIINNGYLGMVRQLQEKIYNTRYQVEMINPDFTKIAEAYDLFATRVTTKEELLPALEKAINHKGTAIVDIMIDSFENI